MDPVLWPKFLLRKPFLQPCRAGRVGNWTPWPEVPKSTLASYRRRPLQISIPAACTVEPQHPTPFVCSSVSLSSPILWTFASAAVPLQTPCNNTLTVWFLSPEWTQIDELMNTSKYLVRALLLIPSALCKLAPPFISISLMVLSDPGAYRSFLLCLHSSFPDHSCPPVSFPLIHILAVLQDPAQILPLRVIFASCSHHHSFSSYKACLCHITECWIIQCLLWFFFFFMLIFIEIEFLTTHKHSAVHL